MKMTYRRLSDLDLAREYLFDKAPFYGFMLGQMAIVAQPSVITISIKEEGGRFYLLYAPKWFNALSVAEAATALKHVLTHVIFGHLTYSMYHKNDLRLNIAKDLAINTTLVAANLPYGFAHPKIQFDYPMHLSTMEYFNLLPRPKKINLIFVSKGGEEDSEIMAENLQGDDDEDEINILIKEAEEKEEENEPQESEEENKEENEEENEEEEQEEDDSGSNEQENESNDLVLEVTEPEPVDSNDADRDDEQDTESDSTKEEEEEDNNDDDELTPEELQGDNHEKMTSSSGQTTLATRIRGMVKQAYDQSKGQGAGKYSSGLQSLIKRMLLPPEIPWHQYFRRYMCFASRTTPINTWMRPNRRFGEDYQGRKKKTGLKVCVFLDESSSVGEEEHERLASEIHHLWRTSNVEVWIGKFDTEVESFEEYKGHFEHTFSKRNYGGTAFAPCFEKAEEIKPDIVVMCTDGENWDEFEYFRPNTVLWLMTPYHNEQEIGQTLVMKKEQVDIDLSR